jgi:hypothetical protein
MRAAEGRARQSAQVEMVVRDHLLRNEYHDHATVTPLFVYFLGLIATRCYFAFRDSVSKRN